MVIRRTLKKAPIQTLKYIIIFIWTCLKKSKKIRKCYNKTCIGKFLKRTAFKFSRIALSERIEIILLKDLQKYPLPTL